MRGSTGETVAGNARDSRPLLSISQLATELGIARATVAKAIDALGIEPAANRKGYAVYRIGDLLCLRQPRQAANDEGKYTPAEILALAKAEESKTDNALKQLKLQREEGSLVDTNTARTQMAEIAKSCIQLLDILPDVLERDCGLAPKAVVRCKEVIDKEREQLAKALGA